MATFMFYMRLDVGAAGVPDCPENPGKLRWWSRRPRHTTLVSVLLFRRAPPCAMLRNLIAGLLLVLVVSPCTAPFSVADVTALFCHLPHASRSRGPVAAPGVMEPAFAIPVGLGPAMRSRRLLPAPRDPAGQVPPLCRECATVASALRVDLGASAPLILRL
jgi:hypothetical protein